MVLKRKGKVAAVVLKITEEIDSRQRLAEHRNVGIALYYYSSYLL